MRTSIPLPPAYHALDAARLSEIPRPHRSARTAALSLFTRLRAALRSWRQRERDLAELAAMSPSELRDIRMTPTDRMMEISKPFWR